MYLINGERWHKKNIFSIYIFKTNFMFIFINFMFA